MYIREDAASSAPQIVSLVAELPPVSSTIGALFSGWGVSMLIFGILCLQTWTYFSRYPKDSQSNKVLVSWLLALEIVHQVLVGHTCWTYMVADYGYLERALVDKTAWSLSAVIVLSGVIASTVKIFLGWRIYKVSHGNYLWTLFLSVMALAQSGLGIVFSVKAVNLPVEDLNTLKTVATVALSLGAAGDIIASVVLSFYLHTMRTGFLGTQSLINRLIVFSVNTGALTSAFGLSAVITFQAMPDNFVYLGIYFFVCKLYSNSLLATLNSRSIGDRGIAVQSLTTGTTHGLAVLRTRSRDSTVNVYGIETGLQIGIHQDVSIARDDKPSTLSYSSGVQGDHELP